MRSGATVTFDTRGGDTELNSLSGARGRVIRPLTADEADLDEVGPMWVVALEGGTTIHAFEDELTEVDE